MIEAPVILANNISKTFNPRSHNRVEALKGVSFQMNEGEVVGLIGPNGAGKTTLLRILLGFLRADDGEVSIAGSPPESLQSRACVGYQADSQFRSSRLSLDQFLSLHCALLGLENSASQIDELLSQFSLASARRRSLSTLSKGMRQKAELSLAFLGSPKLVVLDEPTASLDPPSIFELREYLSSRKKAHTSVFFSSHNLTEVENVCDRVFFIDEGRMLAEYAMEGRETGFLEQAFRKHLVEKKSA